jgi:hypothetical protein
MSRMTHPVRGLLLASFLALAGKSLGCAAAPENLAAPESDHAATPEANLDRGALAAKACRGPEFPGCTTCCEPDPGHGCTVRSWTGGAGTTVIPWYNSTASEKGDCPADCRPCAPCLTRSERDYAALGARPDCDCATQEIGIDPCHSPRSCACYCERKTRILRSCPHLSP